MTRKRRSDFEALNLIVEAGVIDRKATLEDLVRLSANLEEDFGGEDPDASTRAWAFIVKGKFIFKGDDESVSVPVPVREG